MKFENNKYALNSIKNAIKWQGLNFEFKRKTLDIYGEPTQYSTPYQIKGIYHEKSNNFIKIVVSEGANVQSKDDVFITCLKEDADKVNENDLVIIGKRTFKVSGVKNLSNLNIIYSISLAEEK